MRDKRASNRLPRCLTARRMHTIGHHRYCVTGYLMMGAAGSRNEIFPVYRAISQDTFLLETPLIWRGRTGVVLSTASAGRCRNSGFPAPTNKLKFPEPKYFYCSKMTSAFRVVSRPDN